MELHYDRTRTLKNEGERLNPPERKVGGPMTNTDKIGVFESFRSIFLSIDGIHENRNTSNEMSVIE